MKFDLKKKSVVILAMGLLSLVTVVQSQAEVIRAFGPYVRPGSRSEYYDLYVTVPKVLSTNCVSFDLKTFVHRDVQQGHMDCVVPVIDQKDLAGQYGDVLRKLDGYSPIDAESINYGNDPEFMTTDEGSLRYLNLINSNPSVAVGGFLRGSDFEAQLGLDSKAVFYSTRVYCQGSACDSGKIQDLLKLRTSGTEIIRIIGIDSRHF